MRLKAMGGLYSRGSSIYITYILYIIIYRNKSIQQCAAQYIHISSSGLIKSFALFHDCSSDAVMLMCKAATQISISIYYYYFVLFCWWCNGLYFVSRVFHIVNNNLNLRLWRENSTKIKETLKKKKQKNKELLCHVITWCT